MPESSDTLIQRQGENRRQYESAFGNVSPSLREDANAGITVRSPANRRSPQSTLRKYLALLLDLQGRRARIAFVCILLSAVLNGIGVFTLLPVLQLVGIGDPDQGGFVGWVNDVCSEFGVTISLGNVLVVFFFVFTAHTLTIRWMNLVNADLQQSFTKALEQHLYASIMRADWMFFLLNRDSDLTFALTQNVQRVATGTVCFLRLISIVVIAVIHVALCVAVSPLMSLMMLTLGSGFAAVVWRFNRHINLTGRQVVGMNKQLYRNVTDYLSGMKETKSACSEQRQIDSFAETSDCIRDNWLKFTRIRENTAVIYKLGSLSVLSSMVYIALEFFQVSMVEMTLLVVIASRLLPRLQASHTNWQQVLQMLPAFDSLLDLLKRSKAACEMQPELGEGEIVFQHEIQLKDVSFRYGDGAAVLSNLQLRIPIGSTVAIVGPSGAGKSTLADILMGLLSPQEGRVLVGNQQLSTKNLRAWRSQVGYVPQETFLLHDSLKANLLWANPDASDEELREALRLASAEQFVSKLPEGLETILGDRGVRLSGGERQRIALARALVRKPKLLILDEATSALDGKNQLRIQESVLALHGEMTIIIIAHRLSSVRNADQIVLLEDGRVLESGEYDELVAAKQSRFYEMVQQDAA